VIPVVYQVVVESKGGSRSMVRDGESGNFSDKKKAEEVAARCAVHPGYEALRVYIVECRVVAVINGGS
jgi:hypothetical protein